MLFVAALTAAPFLCAPVVCRASSISFAGQSAGPSGHALAASARFELTSPTLLRVTLTNTSDQQYGGAFGNARLTDVLTSLMFDTDPSQLALNPLQSATGAAVVQGRVQNFSVSAGPQNVLALAPGGGLDANPDGNSINRNGAGWAYASPSGPALGTIGLGIVSPARLDPTPVFGIVNDEYAGNGADGLTRYRLVRDTVEFEFAVVSGFDINDIHNVRFVYGIGGNGSVLGGIAQQGGTPSVPVPGALVLVMTGLAPIGLTRLRRRPA